MYDIAIIGAGPAGATLARLIGRRYRVLLIDRRSLDANYLEGAVGKCCGGLLAPDAQKVLGMMGLALPQQVIVGPQIFVVRTIDLESSKERYYQRFYINLDREKFDRWLFSLVPATVDVRCSTLCKNIVPSGSNYELELISDGSRHVEKAKLVIGADGASSIVRHRLFAPDPHLVRYSAIQEWFSVKEPQPHFSVFFDRSLTDFYGWSIPKENALLVGAALYPRQQTSNVFTQLKTKLMAYGYPLQTPLRREGAFVVRPRRAPKVVTVLPGAALIGEAAGWISPSSAEGLSYAFRSALLAANSLKDGLDSFCHSYETEVTTLRRNLMVKNLKRPFMYQPLLRSLVMSSGLEAMDVLVPDES